MKKIISVVSLLVLSIFSFAQDNTFPSTGNVGVGTNSPQRKLHVYESIPDRSGLIIQGNTINGDNLPHYVALTLDGDYGNETANYSQIRSYSNLNNYWGSVLAFYTTVPVSTHELTEKMRIDGSGNVGIGTLSPTEKLSVKGKIRAQEVNVENTSWPDFVFAKSYVLPTLVETEAHIKKYGYLPGLPSANVVKNQGVNLGEMNAKLLQKIEELTLYLIEIEKENKRRDKELILQKEEIKRLTKASDITRHK